MSEHDEMASVPPDAQCPGCGKTLTEQNVMRRRDGEAPAIVPTDVPGVEEEVLDVPVYTLACIDCVIGNKKW